MGKTDGGLDRRESQPRGEDEVGCEAGCLHRERDPDAGCDAKRPALTDPKVSDRLTVPVDADPGRLRRHGASVNDLDLRASDLPQLRYVLQVDSVWHRCGKTDMKLHQKVGRDLDVEGLG